MNFAMIDIVAGIALVYSIYQGFTKGLIISLASLAGLILGVWGAIKFSGVTSHYLDDSYQIKIPILAFCLTFFLILFGIYLLGKGLEKIVDILSLGIFNKIAGAAFSLVKMTLILGVLYTILHQVNTHYPFIENSEFTAGTFAPYFQEIEKGILPWMQEVFKAAQEVRPNVPTKP